MHKIIFDTFEFDLTPYKISTVEENYWFSDQFFTKYSFPGTFLLKDDLLALFGDLLDDNAKFIETTYNVTYVLGNQMESAVFEIESQIGEKVEFTFRFGFDELPNFDKKLAELPLQVILKGSIPNIYDHAKSIISQKWPAVNYNYPQIFTDAYNPDEKTWENFEGIINNYKNSDFLENTEVASEFINRNIIQPLPSVLHIFKQGFLDAGYTLKGDILENEDFKKMLLYKNEDYFLLGGDIYNFVLNDATYTTDLGFDEVELRDSIVLLPDNSYKITGFIAIFAEYPSHRVNYLPSYTNIEYKGSVLAGLDTTNLDEVTKTVEITFTTDSDTNSSTQILEFISGGDENYLIEGKKIFDLKIERILGDKASEVINYNDVDLRRSVPDVTFGKLITEYKKWYNLEVNPKGKDIYINFIEEDVNYNDAIDLTDKEVLKPKKTFNDLDSILLKFKKPDNSNFSFSPVFQNKNVFNYSEENVNDSTDKIEIDILPLPQINRFGLETAFAFDDGGPDKIYVVLYNGLQNDLNTTVDNTCIQLPEVFNKFHRNWFNFRLSSVNYNWLFKMYLEETLKIKKKVFAYGRYHIVKTIDKTQISEDLFDVEIETETLP